ncbi:hypothetical protein TWF718_001855 [Orbilia javanica]|uniref:Uncharacterized protein n=1 Tax=Orbilia javanica TaxID=47235 RepID=A0AAN8N1F1_9PEZI
MVYILRDKLENDSYVPEYEDNKSTRRKRGPTIYSPRHHRSRTSRCVQEKRVEGKATGTVGGFGYETSGEKEENPSAGIRRLQGQVVL